MDRGRRDAWADQAGQSLIEIALALPVLLLLLLGVADGARAYYYAGIVANGAREGANFAARNATATQAQVTQRVCDAMGITTFGSACPHLTVTCNGSNGDATIVAVYNVSLITGSIVESAFKVNPIPIRANARLPLLVDGTPCAS